jgi:PAS domain S-box-containing protein
MAITPISDDENAPRVTPSDPPPVGDADYRLMVDAVLDYAIFLLDPDGIVRTWNAGAKLLKGYDADEIIGRHFSVFYPPDLIGSGWPEHELAVARATGRFEDEGWRIRKDGSRFWANIIITSLLDARGDLRGFSKITRDLTKRREQEEMLRRSEERFRLMVECVQDYAIFMLDPDGRIASWNAGARVTKGYEASEIIGRHFSVFYPEHVASSGLPAEELRIALSEGRFEDEGWRVRKDGTRFWAYVVITALKDEAGRHLGFAKITRDLSERSRIHALESETRRMTMFLATLGHELRNPLAPISNALSIMQMEDVQSQTLRMARDVIGRQVTQMTRLVDDLLDVSRIANGKVLLETKPVDVRAAVAHAVEAAKPLADGKSQTLDVDTGDSPLWISGDPARLVQIVGNLLTNATKFTQAGGRISVRAARHGTDVEISVSDNGPGIAPHFLSNVFGLFVQGETDRARSQGGLGIGLNLVRQLAQLQGGEVAAHSTGVPGQGAEFIVRFPAAPAPPRRAPEAECGHSAARRSVLVVDDNPDAANTLALLLQTLGHRVRVVYDGGTAVEAIRHDQPDAVFLDLGLPGLSGLEVAQRISNLANRPRLIAVTGYGQDADIAATANAGFDAHLVKPLQMAELTDLLDALFG